MEFGTKKVIKYISTLSVLVALLCFTNISEAQLKNNSSPGLMEQSAGTSGSAVKLTKLQRSDGFSTAVAWKGPYGVPVIIGFKQGEIGPHRSFLISIGTYRKIVRIAKDGSYTMEEDDHEDDGHEDDGDDGHGDIPFELCAIDAVVDMVVEIVKCGIHDDEEDDEEHEDHDEDEDDDVTGCILESILLMLVEIVHCLF